MADEAGASPGGPARAAVGGTEDTRGLVVDYSPRVPLYVPDALNEAGYAQVVTGEPEELSCILRFRRPAVALSDLLLSGTDGIALDEGGTRAD